MLRKKKKKQFLAWARGISPTLTRSMLSSIASSQRTYCEELLSFININRFTRHTCLIQSIQSLPMSLALFHM